MSYLGLASIGFLLLFLDVTLAGLLTIGQTLIQPSLTLPFVVYCGLRHGPIVGNISGLIMGLCLDIFGNSPIGSTTFAYSVAGFLCGKLWGDGPFRLFWPWGGFLLGAAILTESIASFLFAQGAGVSFGPLFMKNGLPAAAYTTCLGLLWFLSPLHRVGRA